jgi:hypothetical protein
MLPFLFTFRRREKVEWLMDQYARAVALYPNAEEFHFVGHSNGTYCLVDALERYPCCHFTNVVLAGSVVRTRFDWGRFLAPGRSLEHRRMHGSVRRVLNFVATADWVVAFFPRLFETWLPIQRLGGAGHRGFRRAPPNAVRNITYVKGGHGAGIIEPLWPTIARFVRTGDAGEIPESLLGSRQCWLVSWLGWVPIVIWAAGIWGAWTLGEWLWGASAPIGATSGGWLAGVLVTLYVFGVVRLLRWL